MKHTTRTGTTYRSRSADQALTRRRFSALGNLVLGTVAVAVIAVLLHPPLLGVIWP